MFFLKSKFFKVLSTALLSVFLFVFTFSILNTKAEASEDNVSVDIIKTYNIEDKNVKDGDIISYNKGTNAYVLSRTSSSKKMFGVVVEKPLLVFESNGKGLPISRRGITKVNIFLKKGQKIETGDMITSSSMPGKGKKIGYGDSYILGIAKESVSFDELISKSVTHKDEEVKIYKIDVDISIGPKIGASSRISTGGSGGFSEATVINIIQYVIAGFVVLGSIFVAFRNFMPNLQKGIISMGRNPRARGTIKSMVIFNSIVMILIAVGGFLVGLMIIWLPI